MSDAPILLDYELTQEWADQLTRLNTHIGWSVRAYYTLGYVLVVALGGLALAGVALGVASPLELSATAMRLTGSVAGVIGAIGMMSWATRVATATTRDTKGAYKVGTRVRYRIEPTGIALQGYAQEWQTGWEHVRAIAVDAEVLSLQTPFATFCMPVSQLPLPLEDAVTQMRDWQKGAQA